MKLKQIGSLVMTAIMALNITACGSGTTDAVSSSTGSAGATGTSTSDKLTIWAWDESFNIVAANEAKKIFEANNPEVTVDVVTMAREDIIAKLNTSLASKSYTGLPDIVLIEDYNAPGYLQSYKDEFADLSSVVNPDAFAPFKAKVSDIDGSMYGVPFDSGVAATFYRVDLVEEAGYTKEDMNDLTWEKYIEIGQAVKEKTGVDMCTLDPSDIGQIRVMLQSAGSWYTDAEGNVTLANNAALEDAVETYKNMLDSGNVKQISSWDQFVGALNNGEVFSVVTGCWIAPSIKKEMEQSGKWAVAPVPRMGSNADSVNASSIGGSGWYVLKNVGNAELATKFLGETFATSEELINTLESEISLVSGVKIAKDTENAQKTDPFFNDEKVLENFLTWNEAVPAVEYGLHTYAIESLMTEAVQAYISGGDLKAILADYQTQAENAVA